ncbi:MAG: hypothetical protein U1E86_15275 [Burkholderiaceae bacterium]
MSTALAVGYDAEEDRVQLSFTLTDGKRRSVYLTRRITRALVARLTQVAGTTAEVPAAASPQDRRNLAALHHDAVAHRLPISSQPRKPPAEDERPPLVVDIRFARHKSNGRWMLKFVCRERASLTLELTTEMLHGFIELIRRRLPSTGWDLELLSAPADDAHRRVMH